MKKTVVSFLALCLPMALMAQETPQGEKKAKTHAVYLELLGGSTVAGVTYDSRFNDHTHWGWRAGVSFAYSDEDNFLSGAYDARLWAVPVGVNYLLGNRRNSLELGLGVSLGIINNHYNIYSLRTEDISIDDYNRYENDPSLLPPGTALQIYFDDSGNQRPMINYIDSRGKFENDFGYYFFGDFGYRHVARSGFLFRCGLNPAFNFGDKHAISRTYFGGSFHKFSLGFYLGFGWAF